jgi:hypothetical protein
MSESDVASVPLDSAHCTELHLAGDEQTCAISYFEKQLSKRPGTSNILYFCWQCSYNDVILHGQIL